MKVGDRVICRYTPGDEPEDEPGARHYGIVSKLGKKLVTIQLADGSEIRRGFGNVAVYIVPPTNWDKLYQRQRVIRKKQAEEKEAKEAA